MKPATDAEIAELKDRLPCYKDPMGYEFRLLRDSALSLIARIEADAKVVEAAKALKMAGYSRHPDLYGMVLGDKVVKDLIAALAERDLHE